jgi:hypothetical protein
MSGITLHLSALQLWPQHFTTLQNYSLGMSQFTMGKITVLLDSATADLSPHLISTPNSCTLTLPKLDASGSTQDWRLKSSSWICARSGWQWRRDIVYCIYSIITFFWDLDCTLEWFGFICRLSQIVCSDDLRTWYVRTWCFMRIGICF